MELVLLRVRDNDIEKGRKGNLEKCEMWLWDSV